MNAIKELYSIINQLQREKKELEQQLAAARANELRLRKELSKIQIGSEIGTFLATIEMPWAACKDLAEMEEALATPPGDLSALREVCANVQEELSDYRNRLPYEQLRSGEWTPEVLK